MLLPALERFIEALTYSGRPREAHIHEVESRLRNTATCRGVGDDEGDGVSSQLCYEAAVR